MRLIDTLLPAKKILVYDVAASGSGALSVLCDFYEEVKSYQDKSIQWTFVIGTPELTETENIKMLRMPWIKKSWFHRLYCDWFVMPGIVKKNGYDKIFSLQNTVLPRTKVEQVLYVHQSLPFVDYKYGITENFKLWIYQNIIGRFICWSIKFADRVIVQTNWMKHATALQARVAEDKMVVIPPNVSVDVKKRFSKNLMDIPTFIYPATPLPYKNHKVIVEACKILKRQGEEGYRILFTFKGDENKLAQELKNETQKYNLPIEFIGVIKREKLFDLYSQSILLFPSYIETVGIPMLEARMHGAPIISANTPFAKEILDGYEKAEFFEWNDVEGLVEKMGENLFEI